jgi:Domain of unknown function (DUF4271)
MFEFYQRNVVSTTPITQRLSVRMVAVLPMLQSLRVIAFVILMSGSNWCQSQVSANPFELDHRLREAMEQLAAANPGQVAAIADQLPINPFDVVPHKEPSARVIVEPRTTASLTRNKVVLLPQKSTNKPFVLATLAGALGFLALTFGMRRAVAMKTWAAFFSNNFLIQAQRDYSGMIGAAPFYLLYFHFLVNIGLFAFLSIRSLTGDRFNTFGYLVTCIAICTGLYLLKNLVVNVGGWLFQVSTEAARYNFLILVFCCVLGLFLLPANLFLAFRAGSTSFLPFWVAAVILVFYLFRWGRSIGLFGSFVTKHLFHFLLYLCAVEILPILLIIKLITGSLA